MYITEEGTRQPLIAENIWPDPFVGSSPLPNSGSQKRTRSFWQTQTLAHYLTTPLGHHLVVKCELTSHVSTGDNKMTCPAVLPSTSSFKSEMKLVSPLSATYNRLSLL